MKVSRKQTAVWLLSDTRLSTTMIASALLQWQVCKISSKASDFMHVSHYDRVPCRVRVEILLQDLSGFLAAFYSFFSLFLE